MKKFLLCFILILAFVPLAYAKDSLFTQYISQLWGAPVLQPRGNIGASLTGTSKAIYNYLKPGIQQIANGDRTSTEFSFTASDLGLSSLTWTFSELGITSSDEA